MIQGLLVEKDDGQQRNLSYGMELQLCGSEDGRNGNIEHDGFCSSVSIIQ